MAYVAQQLPENEQNLFAPKGQTTPNPIPPQTGGSSGTGAQGQGAAPGIGTSTQFGSNAAKLSDYLTANAPQIQDFGNKIAGNLNQGYDTTKGNVDTVLGNFGGQVQQGYATPDMTKVNAAASNPTEFVKNPDDVKAFQSWYNGSYSGPENIESTAPYTDINDQVNKAVENASLVGSESGLGTYLNNAMGGQDTTQGMRTLDTALLRGNPNASKAIQDAAAPYKNLSGYLTGKASSADQSVADAKQAARTGQANVQAPFVGANGVIPTFQQDITNRVGNLQKQGTMETQSQNDLLAENTLTPEELATLGIDASTMGDIYGLKNNIVSKEPDFGYQGILPEYFSRQAINPGDVNAASVGSSDDYARAAALAQLTGNDVSGSVGFNDPTKAGSIPSSAFNLNSPALIQALKNELARFNPPPPTSGTGGGGYVRGS